MNLLISSLVVLPDPAFIDGKREEQWKPFYKSVYYKLKKEGRLLLVTELTDELLQPVSNDQYFAWADWLKSCFLSLGFALASQNDGAPDNIYLAASSSSEETPSAYA